MKVQDQQPEFVVNEGKIEEQGDENDWNQQQEAEEQETEGTTANARLLLPRPKHPSKELLSSSRSATLHHEGPSIIVCGVDGTVFTMSANNGMVRGLFASGSELVSSSSMIKEEEHDREQHSSSRTSEQEQQHSSSSKTTTSPSCPSVPQLWEKIVPGLDGQIYSLSPSTTSRMKSSNEFDENFGFSANDDLQLTVLPINVLDITNQPVRTCHRTKPCRQKRIRRNRSSTSDESFDEVLPSKTNIDNSIMSTAVVEEASRKPHIDYPFSDDVQVVDEEEDSLNNCLLIKDDEFDVDFDDNDDDEEETCGIVMGEKRSKLFAVNIQTGSVEWVHSHGERHVSSSSSSSAARGRKRRKSGAATSPHSNTVLLQREDYIVRHIDDISGHETWNVTVGNFHALDFPSSTSSTDHDFGSSDQNRNSANKQNHHDSQHFFVQPPRSAATMHSSSSSNRRSNHGDNNNFQHSLLLDATSHQAMNKPLPWVSFSDDGRKIIAIDAHSRRVLWSKRLPSVIAAVYGVSESSSWRTITVVGDDEFFHDDEDDYDDHDSDEYIDEDDDLLDNNDDLGNAVSHSKHDDDLSLTVYSNNNKGQPFSSSAFSNYFLPLHSKKWPGYYSARTQLGTGRTKIPFSDERQLVSSHVRRSYSFYPQLTSPRRVGVLEGSNKRTISMIAATAASEDEGTITNVVVVDPVVVPLPTLGASENHGPQRKEEFPSSGGLISKILTTTVSSVVVIVLVVIILLLGRYAYYLKQKAKTSINSSASSKNENVNDHVHRQNSAPSSPSAAERSISEGPPSSMQSLFNSQLPKAMMKRALSVDTLQDTHNFQSRLMQRMLLQNVNSGETKDDGRATATTLLTTRSASGLFKKLRNSSSDAEQIKAARAKKELEQRETNRQRKLDRKKSSRTSNKDDDSNGIDDNDDSDEDESSSSTADESSVSVTVSSIQRSQQNIIGSTKNASLTTEPTSSTTLSAAAPASIDGIPLVRYSRYKSEFRELSSLGKGGFGTVFKCENVLDGRAYAVKKIRFRSFVDHRGLPTKHLTSQLKRVLREVKILARLDHPNIVRYYTSWLELDNDVNSNGHHSEAEEEDEHDRTSSYNTTLFSGFDPTTTADKKRCPATSNDGGHNKSPTSNNYSVNNNNRSVRNSVAQGAVNTYSLGLPHLFSSPSEDCKNGIDDFYDSASKQEDITANDDDDLGFSWDIPADEEESENRSCNNSDTSKHTPSLNSSSKKNGDDSSSSFTFSKDGTDTAGTVNKIPESQKSNPLNRALDQQGRTNKTHQRDTSTTPLQMQGHVLYIQMQLCSQRTVSDFLASPEQRGAAAQTMTATMECFWNCSINQTIGDCGEEGVPNSISAMTQGVDGAEKKKKKIDTTTNASSSCNIPHALQIFSQIAKGVQHVHKQGLIHRDLKPSNCFIDENGIVKVGDFGLSRETGKSVAGDGSIGRNHGGLMTLDTIVDESFHRATSVSMPTSWNDTSGSHTAGIGTRLYASPEQMQGSDYDASADVYSLGIILFELCYPMYTGMERILVLKDIHRRTFPKEWDTTIRASLPNIHNLIYNMLSPKPKERPTSDVVASVVERQLAEFVFSLDISPTAFNKKNNHSSPPLLLRVEAKDTEGVLSRTIHLIKESIVGITIIQYGLRVQSQKAIMEFALDIPSSSSLKLQEEEADDDEANDCLLPLVGDKKPKDESSNSNTHSTGMFVRAAHGIITKKLRESPEIERVRQVSTNACLMNNNHLEGGDR